MPTWRGVIAGEAPVADRLGHRLLHVLDRLEDQLEGRVGLGVDQGDPLGGRPRRLGGEAGGGAPSPPIWRFAAPTEEE